MTDQTKPLDLSRLFERYPALETERLLLRRRSMRDAADIFEYAGNPEVTKFMPWQTHTSIEDAIQFIERSEREMENQHSLGFGIELKSEGKVIGDCAFHHISSQHHMLQIGYVLNPAYWGKGYMTEATHEILRYAFDDMGMHRVEAHCDEENERSARVLERCGMTLEGVFRDYELRRGQFITTKIFGLIQSDRFGPKPPARR